jgi:hypothetical protein
MHVLEIKIHDGGGRDMGQIVGEFLAKKVNEKLQFFRFAAQTIIHNFDDFNFNIGEDPHTNIEIDALIDEVLFRKAMDVAGVDCQIFLYAQQLFYNLLHSKIIYFFIFFIFIIILNI